MRVISGHYRLPPTVRIITHEQGGLAICSYPLRVLRLSMLTTRILLQCEEQRTCEQLAQHVNLPTKRVQTLCEQLRWKGLLEAGPTPAPTLWPSVSIIIPSHNRVQELERCIRALLELDYSPDRLEMIVVDDASTDETEAMLQDFSQESATQGRAMQFLRHTTQQGVAKSRNTGAEVAQHDLLAYIDSDCVASSGWLKELISAFEDTQIGVVGGMIRAYETHSLLGRYEDVRSSLFMGTQPQQVHHEGPLTYLPTANLLVRKALWQRLGGFSPLTFGEDVDFCRRLLATGTHMVYLPQGIVYHDYRTKLSAFLNIRVSYASSEAALLNLHPNERRVLLLPPEQVAFAGLVIGGIWLAAIRLFAGARRVRRGRGRPTPGSRKGPSTIPPNPLPLHFTQPHSPSDHPVGQGQTKCSGRGWCGGVAGPLRLPGQLLTALLLTLLGTYTRWRKVRAQNIPISPLVVFQATLRGHLAYTYHLCRHLTRYYTLPLLAVSLLLPPLLLLTFILSGIVIGVDYIRLRPHMSLVQYALCSMLDDCAYEVGVALGCIKHRTWKPLLPIIKRKLSR